MTKIIFKPKILKPALIHSILILALPLILYAETKIKKIEVYAVTVETTIVNGMNTELNST